MHKRLPTNNRRFIGYVSSWEKRIIDAAELAQTGRDTDTLLRIASLGLGHISTFCEAVGLNRTGDVGQAELLAHQLIERAPSTFKAKAILLLANNRRQQDPDTSLALYEQAQRLVDDPITAAQITKMKAVVLSDNFGQHQQAFETLEQGVSLLPRTNVPLCADYLNSLAVECLNLGRFDQARQLCQITTSSTWAARFPEWKETANGLWKAEQRGSIMAVPRPKGDVLKFTPALREPPGVEAVRLRGDAALAVQKMTDTRLLGCIAKLGSLPPANLELMVRAKDISPELAALVSQWLDKHESVDPLERTSG